MEDKTKGSRPPTVLDKYLPIIEVVTKKSDRVDHYEETRVYVSAKTSEEALSTFKKLDEYRGEIDEKNR